MNSKKMMVISLVATVCLSILAVVTIMIVTQVQDGGVEKAAKTIKQIAQKPVVVESPEQQVKEFHSNGIRFYEDEFGTHDVYLEKDTKDQGYISSTGPIDIAVQKLQMQQLHPSAKGLTLSEGVDKVTLVAVTLNIRNTSTKDAYFELKTVRGKADNGEVSLVESLLSDDFDIHYKAGEEREGTVYFMFNEVPERLATMKLSFTSGEDENFQAVDDGAEIKVKLY